MTWNNEVSLKDIGAHYNSYYINMLLMDILRVFLKKSNPFIVG